MAEENVIINGILDFDASQSIRRAKTDLEDQLAKVDVESVVSFDVLTKGNGGFNKKLEEQLKSLREIQRSSEKAANFSITRSLFTGTFEGIGNTFSEKIKKDLTNLTGLIKSEIPKILGSAGLDNAIEDLTIKLATIGVGFAENFDGLNSFRNLSTEVLPQVSEAFKAFKSDLNNISPKEIIGQLGRTLAVAGQEYVKDAGMTKGIDAFLRRRTERFQQQALDAVYERAAEIVRESAGKQPDKMEILGINAADVVKSSTKELIIAIGGYADATTGFKVAARLAKDRILSGAEEIAAIGINTKDVAGRGVLSGVLKPIASGFSQSEVEAAAQAMAAQSLNPNLRIKLFGEGGGGFIAERATNLLNLANLQEKIQGTGVGTPTLLGNMLPANFTNILATDIGGKLIASLSKVGIATLPIAERQIKGATSFNIEGYQNVPEFRQQLADIPLPKFSNQMLIERMAGIEDTMRGLFDTPLETTIDIIKKTETDLLNMQRFADDETLQDVINYRKDLQNLVNSSLDVLQSSFRNLSGNLVKIEDLTISKSPELDTVITQTKVDLSQTIVTLLKSVSNSSSTQFKDMGKTLIKEIESLISSDIFDINVDPVLRRLKLLNRDLSISASQAISAGDLTAMQDLRKQTENIIKELRTQERISKDKDAIKAYKATLGELRIEISKGIDDTIKSTRMGIIESIQQPSGAIELNVKKAIVGIKELLTNRFNKEAVLGKDLDIQDIRQQVENLDEVTSGRIADLFKNRLIRSGKRIGKETSEALSKTKEAQEKVALGAAKGLAGIVRKVMNDMTEAEEDFFKAIPIAKLGKNLIKNVAVPMAVMGASTQIPGAGEMLSQVPDLAAKLADPIAQQIASHLVSSLPGFMRGFAASGISGSIDTSAEILATIIAGQIITGTAGQMTKAIQMQASKVLPKKLKEAIADPNATAAPDIEDIIQKTVTSALGHIQNIEDVATTSAKGSEKLNAAVEKMQSENKAKILGDFTKRIRQMPLVTTPGRQITPTALERQARDISIQTTAESRQLTKEGDSEKAAKLSLVFASKASQRIFDIQEILDVARELSKSDQTFVKSIKVLEGYSGNITKEINAVNRTFASKIRSQISQETRQEIFNEYRKIGDNAIAGLILGLDLVEVRKKSERMGEGIIDEIKKKLKIRSPSGEMIKIGKWIVAGLETIIAGTKNVAAKAGDGLANQFKKSVSKIEENDLVRKITRMSKLAAIEASYWGEVIMIRGGESAIRAIDNQFENIAAKLTGSYLSRKIKQTGKAIGDLEMPTDERELKTFLSNIQSQAGNVSSTVNKTIKNIKDTFNEGVKVSLTKQLNLADRDIARLIVQLETLRKEANRERIQGLSSSPKQNGRTIDDIKQEMKSVEKQLDETRQARERAQQRLNGAAQDIQLPASFTTIKDKIKEFMTDPINKAKQALLDFARVGGSAIFGLLLFQFFDLQSAIFAVQDALRRFTEFENLSQSILNTSANIDVGIKTIARLRSETDTLKVSFSTALKGVAQLQAATQNTDAAPLVPELTTALLQASRVYNLSADQLDRANVAIAQSFSKGVVLQEELRGQLSEALPNAIQVAARAYGMTTKELNKMIASGELSSVFFSKFAKQLKAETAIGAAKSVNTLSASLTGLENSWNELQVSLIENLTPLLKLIVNGLTNVNKFITNNIEILNVLFKVGSMVTVALLLPFAKVLAEWSVRLLGLSNPFALLINNLRQTSQAAQSIRSSGNLFNGFIGFLKTNMPTLIPMFSGVGRGLIGMSNILRITGNSFGTLKTSITTVLLKLTDINAISMMASHGLAKMTLTIGTVVASVWRLIKAVEAFAVQFIIMELISQVVSGFQAWNDAGNDATQSVKALHIAMAENASGVKQYAENLKTAEQNAKDFGDSLPWLVKMLGLTDAFTSKAINAQSDLLSTTNTSIINARNLLSQSQTEGQEVSAKQIEDTVRLLIMGRDALSQQKALTGGLASEQQSQLEAMDALIPKLQKQADLAQGISTTFGQINQQRTEILAATVKSESEALTQLAIKQEAGIMTQKDIDKAKLQLTQDRIKSELEAQKDALAEIRQLQVAKPEDEKLQEQRLKTEEEITRLTKEKAESRMAIRKFEVEQAIKDLDNYIADVTRSNELAAKKQAQLDQDAFNARKISADELARRTESAEMQALDNRRKRIVEEINLAQAFGGNEETILNRISQLKLDLADIELEKSKKVGELVKRRLEQEKELRQESFEQEKARLQQIIDLESARNQVISARENLKTTREELTVARLERARDIVKQLNEDENITAQERINLRQELSSLGINGAASVLGLTQQIANLELSIIQQKAKAQEAENQRALKRLEIESKIAEIANKQAVIAAQEKIISAKEALAAATPEEKGLAMERLRLAESGLTLAQEAQIEINKLKREELLIQQQISFEQQRQNDLLKQLDQRRNIVQAQTPEGRRLQVPLQPYIPPINDRMNPTTDKQSNQNQSPHGNIFNITAPPGFDGRDIGREFAKSLSKEYRNIFK